ncbi:MAG: diaminopimelate epimerase [Acidobacteriia bacterium]|nr:diaminopimelate epimerase [Terriglobia bacterium]
MIPFYKAHGLGNDFLIVDRDALPDRGEESLTLLAQKMCDRHRGIGADGVVFIFPGMDYPQYDFSIRLFNSDGSEAEMSGNGIRCAAAVHHWKSPEAAREVVLGSVVGRRVLRLIKRNGARFTYVAEMGVPGFNPQEIPFSAEGLEMNVRRPGSSMVLSVPLTVEDRTFEITAMSIGNPQCITLVEEFESFDWKRYGRALESHLRFPRKTNVEFVHVIDEHTVEIRIWERGAGHTESSGTGSIASALGALLNGRVTSPVRVLTEGGVLQVEWKGEGEPVFLTGDAEVVCQGIFLGAKGI